MIYADLESILVSEVNVRKYQKYFVCSGCYNLVCVDNKFSKPFKSYLGEDAVFNSNNSMINEIKYCRDVMKIHFNKKIVMAKKIVLRTVLNVVFAILFMLTVMLK